MASHYFQIIKRVLATSVIIGLGGFASAEPMHGIAMYGEPALPADYTALPYVNPDAPKGGTYVQSEVGSFDSMHPFILKGRAPYGFRAFSFDTMLGRSYDEPFTLYGLLAETVETGPNREWVEFTLRPEARFHDGSPVTVEDVIWSYQTLGTLGHPLYHGAWKKVASIEPVGERGVRITFNVADNELPLLMGLRPVLKKADWEGLDFEESSMRVPIGSGPYIVENVDPGRSITLKRNPDYWGRDLPFNRGQHNFDELRYEWFGDGDVAFEAFRAGELSSNREFNVVKWNTSYDFPAVQSGEVVKRLIPHQRPSGMKGLVMNTRREIFKDWRVREAMILAFNYEFISEKLNDAGDPRICSYFCNSELGMKVGAPAEGATKALLTPFAADLPPGALEGYTFPQGNGSERNRRNIRKAMTLLNEAGWTVDDAGQLRNAEGAPFAFELLLQSGAAQPSNVADTYIQGLKRLGMQVEVSAIDRAQYKERSTDYDFDMTWYNRPLSMSPGNEQMLYWGAEGVEKPGTRNYMGMNSPAAEAVINAMLTAEGREDFLAAAHALDRVLTAGRYVIPVWYSPEARLAFKKQLHYNEDHLPIYGDWAGFQPDVWWWSEE
ncbi:extracellular solute-binding protein [Vannielia sp.]|uniref:extracellular solute-binding protein n=1 Tax=Vannielia sp. TaxID=2813045 RepID=UPI00260710D1|nr:extracellular solute-binding protein [Vannielia sp.]MDF1872674.1 extracellular solute-binding protein [Vannielia sp.]